MQFDLPQEKSSIIKVIGVGGGGSNAVNHMYKQGIKDVDFIVCNTDRQVLDSSPVPLKIQLGAALTEGLGAGALPEMGRKAALENEEELRRVLGKTKMLFITAGMGGGTGTGAAPVIAKIAKEMGILTVSICTLPFTWEGKLRRKQAEDGLTELKKYSDSVLVILNDKLREIYHNLKVSEAFAHADNVLSSAAKCIAELINVALRINVDFNDVRRVMETSGVAIMGSAVASGEGRALKAVTQALNSPLLNDNDIQGARYVLVSITCGVGKDELSMDELGEITEYIQEAAGQTAEMIKGYGTDESLGDKVSVTVIASGFDRKSTNVGFELAQQPEIKMVHLEKENEVAAEKKQEKNMDTPMLKSDFINATKETEIKKEVEAPKPFVRKILEPQIELKRVEDKPLPKHIEVKLDPVVPVETKVVSIVEVPQQVVEHPVIASEAKQSQSVIEVQPIIPAVTSAVAETITPPIVQIQEILSIADIETKNTFADAEEPIVPFILANEHKQKSFEFDLTEMSKLNSVSQTAAQPIEPAQQTAIFMKDETHKHMQPQAKAETPPPVNLDIKRALGTNSISDPASQSKITKIAEVSLNSQPPISDNEARAKAQEKIQKLRELSFKVKTPGGLAELENEPAYKRKNVVLNDTPHSSESDISRLSIGSEEKKFNLRPDNSFLHDKPD